MKSIVGKVRAAYPTPDIDTNGAIYTGGHRTAKYILHGNTWESRPNWQGTGVNWGRFEAEVQK